MNGGWTLGLKGRLSELDLQNLLEAILASELIKDTVSVAPVAPEEPFSTEPVEHLLSNGYVQVETVDGRAVELSRGMVIGGFRDWAGHRIESGQPIPACLRELPLADRQAILEAALQSPKDLSDFYQVDLPDNEGVPLIFLDRQVAHDRFLALFARHGKRMASDDWATCNHMVFEGQGEALYSLTGRRLCDDDEEVGWA